MRYRQFETLSGLLDAAWSYSGAGYSEAWEGLTPADVCAALGRKVRSAAELARLKLDLGHLVQAAGFPGYKELTLQEVCWALDHPQGRQDDTQAAD